MLKIKSKKTKKTITVTNTYFTKFKDLEIVETIIDNKKPIYSLKGKGPHDSNPILVKSNFYDFIKQHHPWSEVKIDSKMVWAWSVIAYDTKDLTLELIEECLNNDLLIYFYGSGHMLFDHNKKIVPFAHYYNYIGTVFHNEAADLTKMLEYLKKHKWVINKEDLKIDDIPYYNCHDGKNKFIDVKILPDQKTYQKLYDTVKSDKYWSVRLEDLIKGNAINKGIDPMNLKKFLKPIKNDY